MRRVSVANYSTRPREIELTSYAEVVRAPRADDLAHPAFSNLFIETEYDARHSALFARRRPRSSQDEAKWGVHVLSTSAETIAGIQFETDRSRFLGRGHTTAEPVAVMEDRPLSNTVGAVLDPIFSLRCRVRLLPNGDGACYGASGSYQRGDLETMPSLAMAWNRVEAGPGTVVTDNGKMIGTGIDTHNAGTEDGCACAANGKAAGGLGVLFVVLGLAATLRRRRNKT